MRRQSRAGKREQGWQEEDIEIDDLAVAASFAQASTFPAAPNVPPGEDVTSTSDSDSSVEENKLESIDNEVSREQDDDSDSDDESLEQNKSVDDNEAAARVENDNDSDDGSELDLKEALEKMEDDDDHEGESKKGDSRAPTTEHELDPYRTPLQDLEQKFQLKLTVEEQELLRLETHEAISSLVQQLRQAGNVKCHMIMDRTIVVESVVAGGYAPLDEQTLLVIRVQDEGGARLLPLGKVFEVFGPVSRPLYIIRLPPAMKREANKQTKVNNNSVERDPDEISLNDDEECVKQVPSQEATKEASSTRGNKSIATCAADCPSSSDEMNKHDGTSGDDSVNDLESDPWAPEGNYTKLLQSTQGMTVYYIPDIARLLDTGAIIRNSGRGCDASNLFDEEVDEVEFSDDEQEREYKNRSKKGKTGKPPAGNGAPAGRVLASGTTNYTGFFPQTYRVRPPNPPAEMTHYPQPMAGQYSQQYVPAGAPHTHQHPNPYPYQQAPPGLPLGRYPNYAYPGTVPPPQPHYPPQQGPYAQLHPSVEEEPDTVYYDYS